MRVQPAVDDGNDDTGDSDDDNDNDNSNESGNDNMASGGADSAKLDTATYEGSLDDKTGLYALEKADLFNLLCIPADSRGGDTPSAVYQKAMMYSQDRRAMLIVD